MATMISVSIGDRVIVDIIYWQCPHIVPTLSVLLDNHSGNDNPFSNDCMQITSLYQQHKR
jgi:hypothetical protein